LQLADIAEGLRSVAVKDRKKLIGHAVARHFDRAEHVLRSDPFAALGLSSFAS